MAVRIESQAEPIPGYRLIERLGGGGFGEVWKAEAPGGLLKAIKFVYGDLQTGDDDGVRAEQELKAMSRVKTVRHPYILSLERYDIIDGQLIIVMELADRNLWDRFRECRAQGLPGIPRAELMGYLAETAEALDLMNREFQLQHLDIKPQNLFLVHNHVKVADFGLVKDLEGMAASVTGGVTPVYAAPETFDGWVSRYSDQYSLAIVYQEMLTGQRPFNGGNVRQLVLQHLQGVPNLEPLPPADRPAIARALAKNPDDRHPTCAALVQGLLEGEEAAGSAPGQVVADSGSPDTGPVTEWIRAHDSSHKRGPDQPATPSPSTAESHRIEAEVAGDGALFPALVIGLGSFGLDVLKRITTHLTERFGSVEALPQVRLLHIDTDPDSLRQATGGPEGPALRRSEVLLAPLHRPSHYLKSKEGKVHLDTWLDPKMLYRIPRQAFSAGTRALGRLAFVDNYRAIALKLRGDLQECTNPDALREAARQTGLGLRTSRPKVYIVTSLAGGTGSGMFLDLAYVVRTLLRQLGFNQPEVVGVLLVPGDSSHPGQTMALGNAYAALTELNHFSSPGTTFAASYDTKDTHVTGPIADAGAPFNRCLLLPMPRLLSGGLAGTLAGTHAAPDTPRPPLAGSRPLDLIGHFLTADLTSSLGRCADLARREHLLAAGERPGSTQGLYFQTFGMHRVIWPKRALLNQASRRLCRRLVERWMSKDSKPIREEVKTWVQGQLVSQELTAETLIAALQQAGEQTLGKAPEAALAALVEPALAVPPATRRGETPLPDPEVLVEVMDQLERLLGKPSSNEALARSDKAQGGSALDAANARAVGVLEEALRLKGQNLIATFGQKLAELAVCLIEQPDFRLAGAEEAIRQVSATIEQVLQHHEQLAREFAERALAAYEGIQSAWHSLRTVAAGKTAGKGRGSPPVVPLADLLRSYCKSRYQSLILARVTAIYICLRGQLSDQMLEVGFCRNRLKDLSRSLEAGSSASWTEPDLDGPSDRGPGLGRYLFPPGLHSVEDAVVSLLSKVTEADVRDLDQRLETVIREQFTALVHVCLSPANMLKSLQALMRQEAEAMLAQRLTGANVVDMYLSRHGGAEGEAAVAKEITAAFAEATPDLTGLVADSRRGRPSEVVILGAPKQSAGEPGAPRLLDLARPAVANQSLLFAEAPAGAAADEMVFYREEACLSFADLTLLGPLGREAYRQMNNVEHFTPHNRTDITEWQMAGTQ